VPNTLPTKDFEDFDYFSSAVIQILNHKKLCPAILLLSRRIA
jgi:hypothetical protein